MRKKILIAVVALLLVAGIGIGFVLTNLDHIVKSAIEKYGSAATQASVDLDSVSLSLSDGTGTMSGLTLGNPEGFSTPYALHLNTISIRLDTASLSGTGPIVIEDITIKNPKVYYEMLSGKNNLSALSDNAAQYTGRNESAAMETEGTGRKIIIKSLRIEQGEISIAHHLLADKSLDAALPKIHLTNLGQKNKGITPGEVTEQMMKAITNATSRAAAGRLAKELGDLKNIPGGVMDGAAVGLDAVKGIFGQ